MIATRIKAALDQIRTDYPTTLQPVRRATGSHILVSLTNPPLPVSATILDARATCHAALGYWALIVMRGQKLAHLPAADVPTLVTFLRIHADYLVTYPKALTDLEQSAVALGGIAAGNNPHRFQVGPCPGTTNGMPCPGVVKATVRADDDLLPSTLRCTGTPTHEWPAGEWRVLERRLHANAGVARREADQRRIGMDLGAMARLVETIRS